MPVFDPFSNSAAVQSSAGLNISDVDSVSLPGGLRVSITSFTQALGAEMLTNGNFAAWTLDDPDGWTEVGEVLLDPELTEVASNEAHGGSGTGAVNFFSSATASNPRIYQSVGVVASWYQFSFDLTTYTSGGLRLTDGFLGGVTYASVRTYKRLMIARNGDMHISASGAAPHDITGDNASLGLITRNAQQNAAPSGTFDFRFTLPGTTYAGQLIGIQYRISTASNFILAYLLRNATNAAWDILLDSYATNAPTNLRTVTGVGDPDTIRVVVTPENTHQLYTGLAGVFTARGAVVSNSLYNTAIGINTIYSPDTTPIELLAVA